MPSHNIIDNRNQKLVDHINRILASTDAARFDTGYIFSSGLIQEEGADVYEALICSLVMRMRFNVANGNFFWKKGVTPGHFRRQGSL